MNRVAVLLFCLFTFDIVPALCQTSDYLEQGISQYRRENYEEAIELLKRAREEDRTSSVAPGYRFGRFALNPATTYSYYLVRNPDYEKYMDYLNAGPLFRMLLKKNQILELFAGYADKNYFQAPLMPVTDVNYFFPLATIKIPGSPLPPKLAPF